jgi:hypothetical protein
MFLSVFGVERDSVWGCALLAVASRIRAASSDLLRAGMLGARSSVNAYFQPRRFDVVWSLVTFGRLGVASTFERERVEGEGLLQAISTNGWASNPSPQSVCPGLKGEARD